ncbi:MAG: hypothetical protein LAP38_09710 [Acidobacteriia bacterium]|nr:hypothetical protein [Terriglobia bacterium]
MIVFAPGPGHSLQRVSAAGGVPVDVTKANKVDHRFPVFLPDGRNFLYVVSLDSPEKNGVYLGSLDARQNRRLLADVSSVSLVPPINGSAVSYLLFVRDTTLMAQPFNAGTLQLAGDLFPVAEHIAIGANLNYAPVTASQNGVLVYQGKGKSAALRFVWFDRTGRRLSELGPAGEYWDASLSPDQKVAALSLFTNEGPDTGASDIWLRELSRGTDTRFTFHASSNVAPVWSPNGDRIAFSSNRNGAPAARYDIFQKASSGAGQDELLLSSPNNKEVTQWSPDGRYIVYTEVDSKTRSDVWLLPVGGAATDRNPVPFLHTEFDELQGQISPDSHWMAYTSDESGRREVYVRPFPSGDGKWKVSTQGGEQPRWRHDAKELFFLAADGNMTAVPLKASPGPRPSFELGAPTRLFNPSIDPAIGNNLATQYCVTGDGQRILALTSAGAEAETPLTVVVNWLPKTKPD